MYVVTVNILQFPLGIISLESLGYFALNLNSQKDKRGTVLSKSYHFASFFPVEKGDIVLVPSIDDTINYALVQKCKSYQPNNFSVPFPTEQIITVIQKQYFSKRKQFLDWRNRQAENRGINFLATGETSSINTDVTPEMLVTSKLVENFYKLIKDRVQKAVDLNRMSLVDKDYMNIDVMSYQQFHQFFAGLSLNDNFKKQILCLLKQKIIDKFKSLGYTVLDLNGSQFKITWA